jgi:hypothetical protein
MADDPGSRDADRIYKLDDALIQFMRDPTTPALTPDEIQRLKSSFVMGGPPTKASVEVLVKVLRGESVQADVLDLRGRKAKKE